jgi:hypothetical protein
MEDENKKSGGLFSTWRQLFESTGKSVNNLSKDWWGTALEMTNLVYYIETLTFSKSQTRTLKEAETILLDNLTSHFTQSAITTYPDNKLKLPLTADIDSNMGIVCCLADAITLPIAVELIGRMHFLSRHFYQERLLFVAFGTSAYRKSPLITDLQSLLQKISVSFCYVIITGK